MVEGYTYSSVKLKVKSVFSEEEKSTTRHAIFRLRSDVKNIIESVMLSQRVTRKDLAEKLNKDVSVLSRQLDSSSNLTTRTIAEIMHALNDRFIVTSEKYQNLVQQHLAVDVIPSISCQSSQELISGRQSITGSTTATGEQSSMVKSIAPASIGLGSMASMLFQDHRFQQCE